LETHRTYEASFLVKKCGEGEPGGGQTAGQFRKNDLKVKTYY